MTTTKLAQIARDIEIARCKGHWQAIPELARRYRKYNSNGLVLEQTIIAEATLSQWTEGSKEPSTDEHGPLSWHSRLDPHQVEPLLHQLEAALQSASDTTDKSDKEFAKIVIARCYYECGDLTKALSVIQTIEFKKDDVSAGYGLCLFLQARAIKAICYERSGNVDVAVQSFRGIVALLNEPSDVKNEAMFIHWAEEALYRAVMLTLLSRSAAVQEDLALEFVRAYQTVTVAQPIDWRIHKRMNILRHATRFLSALYVEGKYVGVCGENQNIQQSFASEIMNLYTLYEKMLYSDAHFSVMEETNHSVIDFVNQLSRDMQLLDATPQNIRGYIEVLHRASQKTFNSPTILRHLFHALMRLGDFVEAKHALHSYLHLVGLSSKEWQDAKVTGEALVDDPIDGKSRPIPHVEGNMLEHLVTKCHAANRRSSFTSYGSVEKEPLFEMVHVLLAAVKLYGVYLGDGPAAVEVAEMARKKIKSQTMGLTSDGPQIEAQVFRATGVAYGLLARQTRDSTLRATYHERALDAFCESADLDPHSWETQYHLALQYAEMRDIQNAIQTISRALQTNPDYIPSWHLLALLLSCPSQNDLRRALKTCELGLDECQLAGEALTLEDAKQRISLQITRSVLLGRLYGPEAALEAQEELFSEYGKLASLDLSPTNRGREGSIVLEDANKRSIYQHGMIVSGSLNNLNSSDTQLSTTEERRRRGLSVSSSSAQNQTGHLLTPHLSELHISASRSHDDMRTKAGLATTATDMASRGRSTSTLNAAGRGEAPALLSVSNKDESGGDTDSIRTFSSRRSHHHGLHLFSSRSSSRRSKRDLTPADPVDGASVYSSLGGMWNDSQSSIGTLLQPVVQNTGRSTMLQRQQHLQQARILSDLWLLSASSFLELGRIDEALKAIEEAENADRTTNSRVWSRFGQYFLALHQPEDAMAAFEKGLSVHQHDVENIAWLAKTHMECGHMETAEGLLESLTKGYGWDCSMAWLLLGNIYRHTDRIGRAKECLMYAVDLENTKPIQPFSILPCCI